ncbi:hypothetical protein JTB14_008538 [Gonioctena quinquepunctata]|nr:hypothetical protein JTB14_008538 [Gonioctena quinquepunctata]
MNECQENQICFILLPPNSTHLTQPLEVSCLRPLKRAWRKIFRNWKKHHRGVIRKDHFPRLLKRALADVEANKETNIKSGFSATGLVPLDRQKILNIAPREIMAEEVAEARISASLEEVFENNRFGRAGPFSVGRRNKLEV